MIVCCSWFAEGMHGQISLVQQYAWRNVDVNYHIPTFAKSGIYEVAIASGVLCWVNFQRETFWWKGRWPLKRSSIPTSKVKRLVTQMKQCAGKPCWLMSRQIKIDKSFLVSCFLFEKVGHANPEPNPSQAFTKLKGMTTSKKCFHLVTARITGFSFRKTSSTGYVRSSMLSHQCLRHWWSCFWWFLLVSWHDEFV